MAFVAIFILSGFAFSQNVVLIPITSINCVVRFLCQEIKTIPCLALFYTVFYIIKGDFTLDCYIINLDRAQDRWNATSEKFRTLGLNVIRIPAIEGKDLTFPHPDFAAWRYFFWYGRKMIPNKVACYFSHIKALKTFLETDKEHAMICEDDVTPCLELKEIITELYINFGPQDANMGKLGDCSHAEISSVSV